MLDEHLRGVTGLRSVLQAVSGTVSAAAVRQTASASRGND